MHYLQMIIAKVRYVVHIIPKISPRLAECPLSNFMPLQ